MLTLIDAGPGTGKTYSLLNGYLTLTRQIVYPLDPTEEQQAIFDYICSEFTPQKGSVKNLKVAFFAHGREIKKKLENQLSKCPVKVNTLHGAGQSYLIKKFGLQKESKRRTEDHIHQLTGHTIESMSWDEKKEWFGVKRICHYLKTECLESTPEAFQYLLLKYPDLANYTIPDDWEDKCDALLDLASTPDGKVEFADMPWLAEKYVSKPIYDLGFVDESQDVANSTYRLVTKLCKHVIFCGDRNQAINAFAGASEEMYDKIKDRADAILPLKMTQRCPPAICNKANQIRPGGIIAGPNKEKSIIKDITKASLPEILVGKVNPANTLILSRTNSNIISLAIWMHQKGIPCQIIDKDLGKQILYFINNFRAKHLGDLRFKVSSWLKQRERCSNVFFIEACRDKVNYILEIIDQVTSIDDIENFINETFNKKKQGFKLTTSHKSKGLEAQNIIIINPPIPLSFALDHPISGPQEINLDFVTHTRSSRNLFYLVK